MLSKNDTRTIETVKRHLGVDNSGGAMRVATGAIRAASSDRKAEELRTAFAELGLDIRGNCPVAA